MRSITLNMAGRGKRKGKLVAGAIAFACALGAWVSLWMGVSLAWAGEPPAGVPSTLSGTCYIGDTWMVGEQSFFAIPEFSGQLDGCVPCSTFECLNHTAAAPENVYADYEAEFVEYNASEGWVKYYVTITPPGVTDGVTYNEFGLVGYQRVGGTVLLSWNFNGAIELNKRSANAGLTDGNACYRLDGAVYGVFETRDDAASHRANRALSTFTTDARGHWRSGEDFAEGTYYVAEVTAPAGFVLDPGVYEVSVAAGKATLVNGGTGYVADKPQSNPVTLWAAKSDAQTPDGSPQGNATLAGAQFTICYYDGYYELGNLPGSPTRTWVVSTGEDGRALADDAHRVGGDDFYRTSAGQVTIPLGTVTVQETGAPSGYLVGDGSGAGPVELFQIRGNGEVVNVYSAPTFADEVMRGGVVVGKIDRQHGAYLPQGAASLAGAEFSIENASAHAVIVDGTLFQPGDVVKVVECAYDGSGRAVALVDDDCLPVGSYVVRECSSGEGYLYDDVSRAWSCSFDVTSDGQVVDLSGEGDACANRVIRGDFSFNKVDGQTMARLAGVPFLVTSATTGERHLAMTDENGMLSTAASWNAHTVKTNANDGALEEKDGKLVLDEQKLDPSAGIWFSGRSDAECAPDDAVGALPYDTYEVTELRCKANEGHELVTFSVTVCREARELDLGTIDDNAGPIVNTSLVDDNGVRLLHAGGTPTITDTVSYTNLDMRETYTLRGTMHLVNDDGSDGGVVASVATEFQPAAASGTIGVDFAIDTAQLTGARVVAFEELVDAEGAVIATHEDLAYEGQTIRVPEIATTLVDAADGDHVASAEGTVRLVDTVEYRGLTPGEAYTVTGTLHLREADGTDGGVATDGNGQPLRAHANFVAPQSEGSVQVVFTFAAPDLAERSVVAFEELARRGGVYATHADISDEGQTVTFEPKPEEPVVPEEPEEPQPEEPVVQEVKAASPAPKQKGSTVAKTGDSLPLVLFALAPAAAIGLAGAALSVRRMQKRDIVIRRGPRR